MSDEKNLHQGPVCHLCDRNPSFCGVAGETAMNITFPVLMKAFSVNTSTVQWVTTIYLLVVACVVPLSAYLKRSFRMKPSFWSQISCLF